MDKIFYVLTMYGAPSIEWPATNFSDAELETIEKFLEEFNEHASGSEIDCVHVLTNEEEEEEEDD